MSVLKCMFCGNRMHYHGEPEDDIPMEHYFCTSDKWRAFGEKNLPAVEVPCVESWRCKRCGTFSFFADYVHVSGLYTPKEEFSSEPMQEPFEFGPFWDDILWFDITETDIPASEVLTKFPKNLWLAKNEDEMRLYADEARTKCVGQFRRFHRPETVTVQTMSLEAFKKMLATYDDEIDWLYQNVSYEFIKEKLGDGRIKIIVNRDFDNPFCLYSATANAGENFVDDLINAKILHDGKSLAEAQAEILL